MRHDDDLSLCVFAGPPGSGKSTFVNEARQHPSFTQNYINVDDLAKALALQIGDDKEARRIVNPFSDHQRRRILERGESMAFEALLSSPNGLRFLAEAKQRGYALHTVFVALNDVEENVRRTRARAHAGGHKVPTGRVRDTFEKSLALAPFVLQMSDRMRVYDNSGKDRVPLLEKDHARITLENSHIAWCREKIYEPYKALILEGQSLAKRYAPLGVPTMGPNETLTGPLVEAGRFFIVQRVDGVDMLHPRGLIDPDNLEKFLTDRGGDLHFRDASAKRLRFGHIEDIPKLRSYGHLLVCGENFLVGAWNAQQVSAVPVRLQEQCPHQGRILLANEKLLRVPSSRSVNTRSMCRSHSRKKFCKFSAVPE